MKYVRCLFVLCILGQSTLLAAFAQSVTPVTEQTAILANYGKLPLSFIPNQGQTAPQVAFTVRSLGGTLFFTPAEIVLALRAEKEDIPTPVLRTQFVGANPATAISGHEQLPGTANYFLGNDPDRWQTNLPTYAGVTYTNLYPGIDLHYAGHDGRLKGTYIVAPGSDLAQINWQHVGAEKIWIEPESGDLLIAAATGATPHVLREAAPVAWQEDRRQRVPVDARYTLGADNRVGFVVGHYNSTLPLVIDPVVLVYSTYLGGSGSDLGYGIAVDSSGQAYVTGGTGSWDFPTQNPYQPQGSYDAFVTKLTATGDTLIYSTYLGGSGMDTGYDIAVDSSGQAYVTGSTDSSDFPTQNAYQGSYGGGDYDAFMTKLTAAGDALIYSTYLGGSEYDGSRGIAVDSCGQASLTGHTLSTNFPTQNPYQNTMQGDRDAFVTRFTADGSALSYSTYLGGSDGDRGNGITVDSSGQVYVTGDTESVNFPIQNPYQGNHEGASDGFVTTLTATGSAITYSTYLGGNGYDYGYDIAVDGNGQIFVTGTTGSVDFPTQNPYQTNQGGCDVFVTTLTAAGNALVYSTYLGGGGDDYSLGIAVDDSGRASVTGYTDSTDFPTQNAYQGPYRGGDYDVFVTRLTAAGNALSYSTYLGGNGDDYGRGIAVDSNGQVYVTGYTKSADFPTQYPYQTDQGGTDAFVTKLTFSPEQNENSYLLWTK